MASSTQTNSAENKEAKKSKRGVGSQDHGGKEKTGQGEIEASGSQQGIPSQLNKKGIGE